VVDRVLLESSLNVLNCLCPRHQEVDMFDGAEDISSDGDAQPDETDGRQEHGGTQACS
jgi:hypothetical protein